jgi:glutamine synthetase
MLKIDRISAAEIKATAPAAQAPHLSDFDLQAHFADDVLSNDKLVALLPSSCRKQFKSFVASKDWRGIPESLADNIAQAMRNWALERDATHYAHWFQPLNDATAEKHDALFSSLAASGRPVMDFSGSALLRGEGDGSSFPNGGTRGCSFARAYTIWDPNSPPFIQRRENGNTLCIPSVFVSWKGDSLDNKVRRAFDLAHNQRCPCTAPRLLFPLQP